tara:strand:- start:175 stop:411 length:237 start_codon:yes stop_codon:yes gene_type:complete
MNKKLNQIISEVFNIEISKIDENTNPENSEKWDSFNFYVLLNEIEKEFNIKFDIDETLEIKKIGDFKSLLQKRGIEWE